MSGPLPPRPREIGRVHWMGAWTLFRRELKRYLKEALETVLAPAFQTLVYFVILVFALGPERGTPEGDALLSFALPGLVLMAVLFRAAETTAFSLLFDRMEGIIADILMAPLGAAEMTAAYALAGAISGLVTGTVVLAGAMLVWPMPVASPLTLIVFAALGALMMSLIGVLIGLGCEKWDHMAAAFVFILTPLTFLSGVFSPAEALPGSVAWIIQINPIFHAVDGFRQGFIAGAPFPVASFAMVGGTAAVLWLLCGFLIHRGYKLRP
ncbi:multidrug ABC transporter permease [Skermanella stibiiresistens SB22]|uniref:Transport permease protein n=1 Tax=Skermanella stibiiresistens SB22 TaxID=1385369 RepID=W9H155_9PROT|nr:ABC transporter permease [Skermanella stibiiresistens]EWY38442.1 multidrug ABC transporter permease [Skermanella stibiiresistens SB22]